VPGAFQVRIGSRQAGKPKKEEGSMPWLTRVVFKEARDEPLTELGIGLRQDFLYFSP
jgi:hypothetical protein